MCHALDSNDALIDLSLENNGASSFTEGHADSILKSNQRLGMMRRHLPARQRRLGAGVEADHPPVRRAWERQDGALGALRRSGVGQKQTDTEMAYERTRGLREEVQRFESRSFVMTDYGGKTEFALMHHRHHDRNARSLMAPSVYLIVVNLVAGLEQGARELRWWRRYIRALAPRGSMPTIALIGSRADRCAKPNGMLAALRANADADGNELPEVTAAFAFDCRGAAWPLRDWYVTQHDALVGMAPPIPKPIEAVRERRQLWVESKVKAMPWSDFCT